MSAWWRELSWPQADGARIPADIHSRAVCHGRAPAPSRAAAPGAQAAPERAGATRGRGTRRSSRGRGRGGSTGGRRRAPELSQRRPARRAPPPSRAARLAVACAALGCPTGSSRVPSAARYSPCVPCSSVRRACRLPWARRPPSLAGIAPRPACSGGGGGEWERCERSEYPTHPRAQLRLIRALR
eukprot:scaffold182736_cov28-Tisochrysis_lutea.AAC.1